MLLIEMSKKKEEEEASGNFFNNYFMHEVSLKSGCREGKN